MLWQICGKTLFALDWQHLLRIPSCLQWTPARIILVRYTTMISACCKDSICSCQVLSIASCRGNAYRIRVLTHAHSCDVRSLLWSLAHHTSGLRRHRPSIAWLMLGTAKHPCHYATIVVHNDGSAERRTCHEQDIPAWSASEFSVGESVSCFGISN